MSKRILSVVLAIIMVVSMGILLASCSNNSKAKLGLSDDLVPEKALTLDFEVKSDFKIGLICLHDEKSTYDLNFINSMKRAAKAAGLRDDQLIIKVNVDESNDCYETAMDLYDEGCRVIFADSFGHEDYMLKAAQEKPDCQFCHATGYKASFSGVANYHNAFASIYEGRYTAGVAAGLKLNEMIESGKISADKAVMGYVGAFTYAEVISGYTSFYLGAKSVCPSVTMKVQFTGSWYDYTGEMAAASALIDAGCVLMSQHADSMGAPSACEDKNIPDISYNGATYDEAENTFIISSKIDWAPYFLYIMKCANTGAAIDTDWTGGIETGSVCLTGLNLDVAAEGTLDKLNSVVAGIKAGTVKVFDINQFTVGGEKVTSYKVSEQEVVLDGEFKESMVQSAPYFDLRIDGIELVNEKY